jgi:hypothetical protein
VAKYAVGYLIGLLLVAVFALSFVAGTWGGEERLVFDDIGEEVPAPLPAPPPRKVRPDLDLVVIDATGLSQLSPESYCFVGDGFSACGDGFGADGPAFVSTAEEPIRLSFPMEWSVVIRFESEEGCPPFVVDAGVTSSWTLEELGPAGPYSILIQSNGPQGDASWRLDVDNQSDRALPPGVNC